MAEAVASDFPTVRISKLYHIGTMNLADKAGDSYEGAGISVSKDPYRWGIIARIGHTPLWQCEKKNGRFLDNHKLTQDNRHAMAAWAEQQGLLDKSDGKYVCTSKMLDRMLCKSRGNVYVLGFTAICYAEDMLDLDGVWWQQRFTGTDGPKGVIVPSKINTWTWTLRDA